MNLRTRADTAGQQAEWAARAKQRLPAGGFGNFMPSFFIQKGRGARVWGRRRQSLH